MKTFNILLGLGWIGMAVCVLCGYEAGLIITASACFISAINFLRYAFE